jgi:hypothetical protein
MGLDAVVLPFPQDAPGNVFLSSLHATGERLILRVLIVLNTEMDRAEMGYQARARLYFYLGFQRYAIIRWLSLLPIQADNPAWNRRRRVSAILQRLISSRILEHEAMDEQAYRDLVVALSGDMFALLRLARDQISGPDPVTS